MEASVPWAPVSSLQLRGRGRFHKGRVQTAGPGSLRRVQGCAPPLCGGGKREREEKLLPVFEEAALP